MGLKRFSRRQRKGFTMIEVIVVLGIMALIIPTIFSIFFVTLRSQIKVHTLQNVKRNGDSAMQSMTELIKKFAISVHSATPPGAGNEVCGTTGSSYSAGTLYFEDINGGYFSFSEDSDRIASASSAIGTHYLTTSSVGISNFAVTCSRASEFSTPLISISYSVTQAGSPGKAEEEASLSFQTKVRLRNY